MFYFHPFLFPNSVIRALEGHFQCVHTIRFSEPTKIGSEKTDGVNGPLDCTVISGEIGLFRSISGNELPDGR